MARLLEHQGKRLLAEAGIATPRGVVATTTAEAGAAAREIGGPVAIKAQVPAGGRGLAGGVRFAGSEAEAASIADELIGSDFLGFPIETVLVEERLEIAGELYVAVMSEPTRRAPVLIFSTDGGVDIEKAMEGGGAVIGEVDILKGIGASFGIDLVRGLDLDGRVIAALGRLIAALYGVYRRNDCTLAEINPLAVTKRGLVALDARIAIDDDALFRHRALHIAPSPEVGDRPPTPLELVAGLIDADDHRGSAHFVQIDPDGEIARGLGKVSIGFDGIGTGVSLTTMDELVPAGFYPKNFCDTSGNPTSSKLYRITRVILSQPGIEGYVFASCLSSQQLDNTARGIVKAFKEIYGTPDGRIEPNIPCVFSFRGAWDETALDLFDRHGLSASPLVRVLGRDSTERDLAVAFGELHGRWKENRP